MANFSKKLEQATEEELYSWVNELDFRVVPLASDELTRRYLRGLRKSIRLFNKKSSEQTEKMIRLTWLIAGLTGVLVVGLLVQIYLAKIQVAPILSDQERNERQAYEFCKEPGNASLGWPDSIGREIPCNEVLKMIGDKYK
ncbi:MAG: hypothetical protein A3C70_00600 [Candidatus Zambryskibacteria bacterium RIFCSPHIGHO2_02_FULL_43_14]|uniref:Uncharacterized protein n=1 Tax=Candidatus Zambryskibacteria bacterium RIFCSPHIGHO2_02_FULL_43_14 TaxID=1802748 RepID=A0A1G2TEP2_9BACT|nr:MAG: hypothetical protein A2829_02485 [Candidatus Zambryskibacteria bacterium RIFCSPHIGHO2_01_FULL_43_60]OHA95775.1 MAG: hypothetical protein A3C70_00600 [Candidatus Zambryskibacteria bacterium RIFCSPHIGHO2_02_FULL_43_14]OHB03297.1 MAG: hypothetical protein A3B03_00645 [Candidatus Zambryskibacteria bacterium RIFCSPLOWO2_01_FULL_42_41]